MAKIVNAVMDSVGKITIKHKKAVAELRQGAQSQAWKIIGEILETAGKIIYICTIKVLTSTL